MALRLFDIYLSGSPQVWLQDDVFLHPYAHLMAILLVTLKLCCQLDIPGAAPEEGPDWQAWARAVLQHTQGPHAFPATALEVWVPAACHAGGLNGRAVAVGRRIIVLLLQNLTFARQPFLHLWHSLCLQVCNLFSLNPLSECPRRHSCGNWGLSVFPQSLSDGRARSVATI